MERDTGETPGSVSDLDFVGKLLAGDPASIHEVRRLIRLTASAYRRFLANDLEDLEQEILMSLLRTLSAGEFRHDSSLATFVRRMVHNSCIDLMRAAQRRSWSNIDDLDLAADQENIVEALCLRDDAAMALRIAGSLSRACRDLWRMIHDGLSYQEMADRLGVARGALRVRVLRCRRKAVEVRDRMFRNESN